MALMRSYEDSGGEETYPRQRVRVSGAGGGMSMDSGSAPNPPTPAPAPTPEPQQAPQAPTPNYQTLGPYASRLGGYDMSKFSNPYDQWSEKYKIGGVQSWFDPLKGVTPEYLAALNSLGIAGFSGSGDQLSVTNTKNDPRFGTGGVADVVKGLKGQNADTMWGPWFVDDQAQQSQQGLPDLSAFFNLLSQQSQPQAAPSFTINQPGIDPAMLQQILSMIQPPQQQAVTVPAYQPSAPVTQATPMALSAPSQSQSVQTQAAAPTAAPGMDPFMAWLSRQIFGGNHASV